MTRFPTTKDPERMPIVSKLLFFPSLLSALLILTTGYSFSSQELDADSLVADQETQIDAAASGDISDEQKLVGAADGSIEKNIEKDLAAPAEESLSEEPATASEAPVAATTPNTEEAAKSGDAASEAEFRAAVADAKEKSNPPKIKKAPAAKRPVARQVASLDTGADSKYSSVVREEALRRQAQEQHGKECLREGQRALERKDYENAAKLFEEAKKYLGGRIDTQAALQEARKGLGIAYYKWALALRRQGNLTEAEQKGNLAIIERYPGASKLVTAIQEEKKGPPPKKESAPSKRWQEPEHIAKDENVSDLLARGRQLYMTGELDSAQDMYERVLKKDPYNTEAIRLLDKVAQKRFDVATMELDTTRHDMIADVRKTWNPRTYALLAREEGIVNPNRPTLKKDQSNRLKILTKMENIKIPEIDFRQANINDVIQFLQAASMEYDQGGEADNKGVNIILNLGAAPAARPAEGTGGGDFGAATPADGTTTGGEVPLITFNARQISLLEALKIVTQVSNLKFRIEETVVMIVPLNAPDGTIIQRWYDVLPTVVEKIKTVSTEVASGSDREGTYHGLGGDGESTAEPSDWKQFFKDMGVQWPDRSSIKYVPAVGKIVVANTADNLTEFEKILAVLNLVPNQIEIEARFVEVKQTDLGSLGFEWLLTDDWEIAQKKGSDGTALGARQSIQMEANSGSGGFTKGNRFASSVAQGGTGSGTISDDIITLASVLTNPEMSFVIHALEQKGDADLLSAPKVTTQSGVEATIKVVTEYIYPTEFSVTPITGQGLNGVSTIVGGVVEPGGFETREVGVILKVTPEVSTEGQMISLTMAPEVVTDPDWRDYGSVYTAPDGSKQVLNMEQPFFHTRAISTSISIYNGATVVMGGMINESRTELDDKIPILGDVPLVGRLFRSKVDSSEKRNLLIFVTARLVDPAGRPILPTTENALQAMGSAGPVSP